MAYEMREKDGHAVVVDHNGKSIVDIIEEFDEAMGCKVLTPVFTPEMAIDISAYLNAQEKRRMPRPLPIRTTIDELSVRAENCVRNFCSVRGQTLPEHVLHTANASPRPKIYNAGKKAWAEIDALARHFGAQVTS